MLHLLCLLDDPDASLRTIASAASRDVALTARMLRLANSAHFGLARTVGDVATALQVIGLMQTRQLVLASGVMDMTRHLSFYGLTDRAFRQHSERVATLAMVVAHRVQYGDMGLAYTAGLLHDVGKVVINGLVKARTDLAASTVADMVALCGGHLGNIEYALSGTDHARAGGELAELWRLPPDLTQAIAGHHLPLPAGTERSLLTCVSLANALASALDPGYPAPNRLAGLPESSVIDMAALVDEARACAA